MNASPVPRAAALAALPAILIALFLSACGGDASTTRGAAESGGAATSGTSAGAAPADPDAAVSTTLDPSDTATSVPEIPENDDPSAVQCTGEPKEVFDATAIVGESIDEATDAAAAAGCMVRVVIKDGKPLAATQDFRTDRINVATEDDQVKKIVGLG